MTKIETVEQARVWLATYEAEVGRRGGVSAMEEADKAVEAWRSRVGAVEKPPREEADLLREQRDKARTLLDDVRRALLVPAVADEGLPFAVAMLREALDGVRDALPPGDGAVVERVKAVVKSIDVLRDSWRMCAHPGCIQGAPSLIAERNSLQEDLVAMQERLRASEESSAASHKDLAAVREALGGHNNPELSMAECAKALTKRVDVLRETLAETINRHHVAMSHDCVLIACDIDTCREAREALGPDWLKAWLDRHL